MNLTLHYKRALIPGGSRSIGAAIVTAGTTSLGCTTSPEMAA